MAKRGGEAASGSPTRAVGRFRSGFARLLLVTFSFGVAALLVEGAIRWLPVDVHSAELARANPPELLAAAAAGTTVLVFGDSFSADPAGWVPRVRERLGPEVRVINSAVSGFTSRPIRRMAPRRLARFAPRVVVLQLYAGNDLLELAHPVRWSRTSPIRSLAWALSDAGSEAVPLLNYRAGQLADALRRRTAGPLPSPEEQARLERLPFDPATFTGRERRLLDLDPDSVEKQLFLEGEPGRAFPGYVADLSEVVARARAAGAAVVVVVVPHAAQVSPELRRNWEALGARFTRPAQLETGPSRFAVRLRERLEGEGVTVVDPLPLFRSRAAAGVVVYRPNDSHLSREGQALLAEALALLLRSAAGLPPAAPPSASPAPPAASATKASTDTGS